MYWLCASIRGWTPNVCAAGSQSSTASATRVFSTAFCERAGIALPYPPWRRTMTEPEVAARTEDWVRGHFSVNAADPRFARDADLFEGGYVDSVGLAELLAFLEEEFSVEIPDEVLVSDEFATIEGIARIVCRLVDA